MQLDCRFSCYPQPNKSNYRLREPAIDVVSGIEDWTFLLDKTPD